MKEETIISLDISKINDIEIKDTLIFVYEVF